MTNHRRNWHIIGGLVILCGLLMDGAALGQNAPADQNSGNTASHQNAAAGQTASAATNLIAQNAATPGAAGQSAETSESGQTAGGELQEVVVTATHFATAVNQTPIAITAVTTTNMLQEGINTFANLAATVPALSITSAYGTGLGNIAIRGIIQNGQGSATTGFYLDNAPLQMWNNAVTSGASPNGTPLPPIFDLSRVEVLEGPQGTLFGASSEGGTIRYITPTPDLEKFDIYAKLDGSHTDDATGSNYNGGLAVGGPIIPGVLAFRASVYTSHQAGWINAEDPLSQQVYARGLNSNDAQEFHGALLWQPTQAFSAQASFFSSYQSTPYAPDSYDQSEPYPIVVPELGFNTTTPKSNPTPVCVGAAACAAYSGTITYLRPGATYGPYPNLGPYTVLAETPMLEDSASTHLAIPSLDLTYNFPSFTAQLFSSYVRELALEDDASDTEIADGNDYAQEGPHYIPYGIPFLNIYPEQGDDTFETTNQRQTWAEDLRVSSVQLPTQMGAGLFSWTAGLFYEHDWSHTWYVNVSPVGQTTGLSEALFGETSAQRWGAAPLPVGDDNAVESYANNNEVLSDTNAAVYAEANYNLTNRLQATLGARESLETFFFAQQHYGPAAGFDVPTTANGGAATGTQSQSPFTPKGELTYRFSDNKLIYALADEGFRPGGANTPEPAAICGPGAAQYGLTTLQLYESTKTYNPDTDWNYEAGTKLGLANGRVQLNGDVYHIVWSHVQTSQAAGAGCGSLFTANAGHAVSQGFEFSGQALPLRALALNWAVGFDHAYYTEDAIAVKGPIAALVVAEAGQDFPLPQWTFDVGARLDLNSAFQMGGRYDPYLRADWNESTGYNLTEYPLGTYDPDTNHVPAIPMLNVRAGVDVGPIDVNLYALNALNFDGGPETGGRSGCASNNPACTVYTTYTPFTSVAAPQPLTVGLQLTYTH